MTKVASVALRSGFEVDYLRHAEVSPIAPLDTDYSMSDRASPLGKNALVFGRCLHAPFWQIEQTPECWRRDVAFADFDPTAVPKNDAARFYQYWRERLFGDAPLRTTKDGFVYVPLQDQLTTPVPPQMSTQLDMLNACLAAEPERPIIAALNPNITYADQDLTALNKMDAQNDRLTVRIGAMKELLRTCDYVVTQNSAVAFNALFFGKPSILFSKADFHHVTLGAAPGDVAAFRKIARHKPEWARYVWWFWQRHAINLGRKDVEDKIAVRLRRFGWPIK
ncbi:hypothetical protein ACOTTU_09445 [Roseobacter sp. EG26]|uniref:capsular polysaccharide export protein, LipB/KpsS family n=1 Tax=Roseobacter sp. EG26 TaxID=3412477 RepID=UPI003CE537C4